MSSAYGGGAFCVSNDPALGGEASRTRGSNGADVVPVKLRLGRDSQHEGAVLKCVSCQYSQSQQVSSRNIKDSWSGSGRGPWLCIISAIQEWPRW